LRVLHKICLGSEIKRIKSWLLVKITPEFFCNCF
jgi:hypothetical protein